MLPVIIAAIETILPESIASIDYVAGALKLSRRASQAWEWSRSFSPGAVQVFSSINEEEGFSQWSSPLEQYHLTLNLFAAIMQTDVPSKDSEHVRLDYLLTCASEVIKAYSAEPATHTVNIVVRAARGVGYTLTQKGYQINLPMKKYLNNLPQKLTVLDPVQALLQQAYGSAKDGLKVELTGLAGNFDLDKASLAALAKLYQGGIFDKTTMTINPVPGSTTADESSALIEEAAVNTSWSSHSLHNETLQAVIAKGAEAAERDNQRREFLSPVTGIAVMTGLFPEINPSRRRQYVQPTRVYITTQLVRKADTELTEDLGFHYDEATKAMVRNSEAVQTEKSFSSSVMSDVMVAASVNEYYKKIKKMGAPGRAVQRTEQTIIQNIKNFIKPKN